MKNSFTLLAAAASFGAGVDATSQPITNLGAGFVGASAYNPPATTNNKCTPEMQAGYNFANAPTGQITSYGGMNLDRFTCQKSGGLGKRGQGSTFPAGKVISGSCTSNRAKCPSIGVNTGAGASVQAFSINKVQISTQFNARIEAHYEMPNGNICKTSHNCNTAGTTISNTQCGGAKKVSFVYPPQPQNKQTSCNINIHQIDYNCKPATPPYTPPKPVVPPYTPPKPVVPSYTPPAKVVLTTRPVYTPPVYTQPARSSSSRAVYSVPSSSRAVYSVPSSSTVMFRSSSSSTAMSRSSSSSTAMSRSSSSSTAMSRSSSSSTAMSSSSSSSTVMTSLTTYVKTYETVSTDFVTSTKTIFSCAPEVTNCPARSTGSVVTYTVPVSSTVMVTETAREMTASTSTYSPPMQTGEMPCPAVVPKCLNTFMYMKRECANNMDAKCYCPSKEFVDNIYSCLYAHGESDNVISKAVSFFQGICAPHIKENPAIVYGAEKVTTCISVTGTPMITAAPYTTYSYSSTVVTVPQVNMPTYVPAEATPAANSSPVETGTADVPGDNSAPASAPAPADAAPADAAPADAAPADAAPAETMMSYAPMGTGAMPMPATTGLPVAAGAARIGSGLGLAAIIAAVLAL